MKRLSLLLVITVLLVSCGKNSKEYKQLKAQNDSLVTATAAQTAEFNETLSILNEVEDNFSKLREAENYLIVQNATSGELSKTQRERITDNFELIGNILQQNKEQLRKLEQQVNTGSKNMAELRKTIARLQEEVASKSALIVSLQDELGQRDQEISRLSGTLADLMTGLDSLSVKAGEQSQQLKDQEKELYTAWYIFGTRKELRNYKVLDGNKVLEGNYNRNDFIKIDIRNESQIPLYAKKAKVLTSHPEDSYKLIKGTDKTITLMILDYKKFWSASKFLVVEV